MQHRIADEQDIVKAEFAGHMADVHIVPVLSRIELVEVVGLEETVREECAAEGESFGTGSVLLDLRRIVVGEVDLILVIMRHGCDKACLRLYGLSETIQGVGFNDDITLDDDEGQVALQAVLLRVNQYPAIVRRRVIDELADMYHVNAQFVMERVELSRILRRGVIVIDSERMSTGDDSSDCLLRGLDRVLNGHYDV